jgi:hypothetical protein
VFVTVGEVVVSDGVLDRANRAYQIFLTHITIAEVYLLVNTLSVKFCGWGTFQKLGATLGATLGQL